MASMSLKEFVDCGLLQEINRQFLHPMGLALSVAYEDGSDTPNGFSGIWDYRDDPEGLIFSDDNPDFTAAKAKKALEMFNTKREARMRNLGYHVQPPPKEEG